MSSPTPVKPVRSEEPNPTLYNHHTLKVYRLWVQKLSHPWAWRCPYPLIERTLYSHAGPRHVDVGPGPGHALARLPKTTRVRDVHLVDINPDCLDSTDRRIGRRFTVRSHEVGALAHWPIAEASVDSVAAINLLHCLPGNSVQDKRALFDNAARVLRDGGQMVGASYRSETSLGHTRGARRLLRLYNNQDNTMHNHGDRIDDLVELLRTHPGFEDAWVDVCGSVMLWRATHAPAWGVSRHD